MVGELNLAQLPASSRAEFCALFQSSVRVFASKARNIPGTVWPEASQPVQLGEVPQTIPLLSPFEDTDSVPANEFASAVLSGGLFAFDHLYLPETNRRQDALRNIIKGKSAQTYLRPDRKWIHGRGEWFYFYKGFDADQNVMAGVSVFEIDPKSFQLTRHIQAEKARWEPSLKAWVFQNGWSRDFRGQRDAFRDEFHDFRGQTATFPELDEPPEWFFREVKQYFQMNYLDLASYIQELSRSGLNTVPLQVQYHKKFAVPLFALIMALISIPFSFVAGARGAMAGVGVSFGIAIAYFTVSILFEQIGNLNQLPPQVAAWAPDTLFTLTGLYFMARLRS